MKEEVNESQPPPPSSLFIAVVAVKPQLNYYLYFNCTYESNHERPVQSAVKNILVSRSLYLCSEALKSSSAVFREVGLGVGNAAELVQYSTVH